MNWTGPALVDGKPWPFANSTTVWLSAGRHSIEPGAAVLPSRIVDFNGDLKTASVEGGKVQFSYESSARAIARVEGRVGVMRIDGVAVQADRREGVVMLPRGQHVVELSRF